MTTGNGAWHPDPDEQRQPVSRNEPQEGKMAATRMADTISPKLLRVMERAKRDPQTQFLSLVSPPAFWGTKITGVTRPQDPMPRSGVVEDLG